MKVVAKGIKEEMMVENINNENDPVEMMNNGNEAELQARLQRAMAEKNAKEERIARAESLRGGKRMREIQGRQGEGRAKMSTSKEDK
jgi:hypothetical protein